MRVLAKSAAVQRLADIEALQLDLAIKGLSPQQTLLVLVMEFLLHDLHDLPGAVAMSRAQCADWLHCGLPRSGLPRRLRPVLEQAHDMTRRFMAAVDTGQPVPDDLADFCVWLVDQAAPAETRVD